MLRGSWPGEGARVRQGNSPKLSEGAPVWQQVGKGMGPPSIAAPAGEPAAGPPHLVLKHPPTCFSLPLCTCVNVLAGVLCACMCARGCIHVWQGVCMLMCGCVHRPVLRPPLA